MPVFQTFADNQNSGIYRFQPDVAKTDKASAPSSLWCG